MLVRTSLVCSKQLDLPLGTERCYLSSFSWEVNCPISLQPETTISPPYSHQPKQEVETGGLRRVNQVSLPLSSAKLSKSSADQPLKLQVVHLQSMGKQIYMFLFQIHAECPTLVSSPQWEESGSVWAKLNMPLKTGTDWPRQSWGLHKGIESLQITQRGI